MLPLDPISLSIGAIGLGLSFFGGQRSSEDASAIAAIGRDKAAHEGQINDLKMQQTQMEAQRTQLQNIRNTQRARAMAIQSATTQGAQFGSGLQGGLSSVQNQGLFNMQGVNQALQTSQQIYGQDKYITGDNEMLAQRQGNMASDQGLMSLGNAFMKTGSTIGQFFGSGNGLPKITGMNSLFGNGSPSGY